MQAPPILPAVSEARAIESTPFNFMSHKRTFIVAVRFTEEEMKRCQAWLASLGAPSLTLSAFLHDKVVAMVAAEGSKPSPKKGAHK